MLSLLIACSRGPAPVPRLTPDEPTTTAAIDALCKIVEGAGTPCERRADGIRFGSHEVGVQGSLLPVESGLGITVLRGTIDITDSKGTLHTRLRGFGGGRSEALERSIHECALVAVEPSATPVTSPFPEHTVHRGWTLYQPRGVIDHDVLLQALAPAFQDRSPAGVLTLEITHQGTSLTAECWFNGEVDAAACERARAWSWPIGDYELRTAYVVGAR